MSPAGYIPTSFASAVKVPTFWLFNYIKHIDDRSKEQPSWVQQAWKSGHSCAMKDLKNSKKVRLWAMDDGPTRPTRPTGPTRPTKSTWPNRPTGPTRPMRPIRMAPYVWQQFNLMQLTKCLQLIQHNTILLSWGSLVSHMLKGTHVSRRPC